MGGVVTIRRRKRTCGFQISNLKLTNGTEDQLDLTKEETTTATVAKLKRLGSWKSFKMKVQNSFSGVKLAIK
jgi:hypothetical protein